MRHHVIIRVIIIIPSYVYRMKSINSLVCELIDVSDVQAQQGVSLQEVELPQEVLRMLSGTCGISIY